MELNIRNLVFVTFVTLLFSGFTVAQLIAAGNRYGINSGTSFQLSFTRPANLVGVLNSYETTKIYRQVKPMPSDINTLDMVTFDLANVELILTWVWDEQPGNNGATTLAAGVPADKYMFTGDTQNLNPSLDIMNLTPSDHGYYWARFEDTTGGTGRDPQLSLVILDYYVTGTQTLNDPSVVDGCPVTYTCVFSAGFPQPEILWTINQGGTEVDITAISATDPRYTITTNNVQNLVNPGDTHTATTTSTLVLSNPELLNTNNPAAYDANMVRCRATQSFSLLNSAEPAELTNVADMTQTLEVLVEPKVANMRYEANVGGNAMTFTDGQTIDVNANTEIVITARVTMIRNGATITFTDTGLTPANGKSEGTEVNAADGALMQTTKTYTFTPTEVNAGDFLLFRATNDAVTASGGCKSATADIRLNFNILAGPKAEITYTDPVSSSPVSIEVNAATSVAPVCTTSTNVINILANNNLMITCQSIGVDPATTITIFQGDGGDLATGDTILGTSTAAHVTEPTTDNFNTVFNYQFTIPPIAIGDHNDVITCRAANANNEMVYTAACLKFLVAPRDLTMFDGGVSSNNPSGSTVTATERLNVGDNAQFTCRAIDGNPDTTDISWTRGGTAVTSGITQIEPQGADMLYDTLSTVAFTATAAMCNQVLACSARHDDTNTDLGPVSTTLKVAVAPTSTSIALQSGMCTTGASLPDSDGDVTIVNGATDLLFRCTVMGADEEATITINHLNSADAVIGGSPLVTHNAVESEPDCSTETDTGDHTLTGSFTDQYTTKIQCCAENSANTGNPVCAVTNLDVQAKVIPANMEMIVQDNNQATVAAGASLIPGIQYTITCIVRQATPQPTIMIETPPNNSDAGSASTTYPNVPAAQGTPLANILTASQHRYTADSTHCNMDFKCTAVNNANTLCGESTPQEITRQIKVATPGPTSVTLELQSGTGATPVTAGTAITATVVDGVTNNMFQCAVMGADEEADVTFDLVDSSDVVIANAAGFPVSRLGVETTPDCTAQTDNEDLTLSADFASQDGNKIRCCAKNSGNPTENSGLGECATATLDVQIKVNDEARKETTSALMQLEVRDSTNNVVDLSTTPLTAGQTYDIYCIIREATPPPTITIAFPTSTTQFTSPQYPNVAKAAAGSRAGILTATRSQYVADAAHCGMTLTCSASNTANTGAAPSISQVVNINSPLTTSPMMSVNQASPNNPDQDNNPSDATAELFRNTPYVFDCTFPMGAVNPPPHIRWDLYDKNNMLVHTATDQNSDSPDCTASAVTESYDLTAARVTFESLEGGFLVCTAYTGNAEPPQPDPYNAATNPYKDSITFVILTPPSEIKLEDHTTDDDGDGLTNDPLSPDPASNKLPLCEGDTFDLKATAVASNPGLTSFDIKLAGTTLGSGNGVTIDVQTPVANAVNGDLFDTSVIISLSSSYVTFARNGQLLEICAPNSQVCNDFIIDIVASPQDPPTLTVTDPFAPRDPTQPDPRTLIDGNALRLHYNKAYTFTCTAQNARPAAELVFSLVEPLSSVVLQPTNQADTADGNRFDSTRTVIFTPGNLDATGHKFCCTATNAATASGCNPSTVDICVDLEIIEEPEDLKMFQRMQSSTTGRRRRQSEITFTEITEQYTDLTADANFDIRCVAERSAPAAVITWSITRQNNAPLSANLAASLNAINEAASPSTGNALAGEEDQGSTIQLMTTEETLGATVKCCAHHVAIPGGTGNAAGNVYDEDPSLTVMCKNTTIRFPVGAQEIQIWIEKGSIATRQNFDNGALVKANADEPLQLNCTAYRSRPYVYIGWTGMDTNGAQDNSFISSDCQFVVTDSPTANADPLTHTVDTTKCVNLLPKEEHHGLKVYCTGTNIADTTGATIQEYVTLDLCVPCKNNLQLKDANPLGSTTVTDSYTDGQEVVLLRNGNSRTLECSARGREQPVIDFYLQEAGKEKVKLTDDVIDLGAVLTGTINGLYLVRKQFTLSLSNARYNFNGATLFCECANAVNNVESTGRTSVVLKAFEVGPTQDNSLIGTGNSNTFATLTGNQVTLTITGVVSDTDSANDPFSGSNFPPPSNILNLTARRKRQTQTNQPNNQLTCVSRGTNPAVDFIWKLDGQVITGTNINTFSQNSILNQGNEGLVDTFSTFTFDPLYRGYHSRELCCEVSSSLVGSPIRQCVELAVFSGPNEPMEIEGTTVVNEGQTVQLQCTATEQYPKGVFSWDDDSSNTAPVANAQQTTADPKLLPNFRYEQSSTYSFVTRREDNRKEIVCEFDQNYNENGIEYSHKTTEKRAISVNFCPSSSAELTGCPNAPVAPGRDVTIHCQSGISNPAVNLDWYQNNIKQNPAVDRVSQVRDYGYVTTQSFTTRQLALADNGIQLQCCPVHTIPNIGCPQLCSSVCTVSVATPTAETGCRWIRVEMTLDRISGNPATWDRDYANHQSAKYQDLTTGLLAVVQQILDGQQDYRSTILPTLVESTDGLIQAIFGVEFNSPYRTTTGDVQEAISLATNADGNLVGDGGAVSSYQILPNSATAVCVCEDGYCLNGPDCRPSTEDYSSSCQCPTDYSGTRCETHLPGQPTRPPSGGVKYARLGFILAEINNQPATWNNNYNDPTHSDTTALTNGLDDTLTKVFEAAFTTCFINVRIADLFESSSNTVGVIAGVEFSNGNCGVTIDDVRTKFIDSVDGDQRIDGSNYKLNSNFLQETNVEEICGNDFSCSNGGTCQPSENAYYSSCRCNTGYSGDRCQTIIPIPATQSPTNDSGSDGLSTNVIIGIIIGVVLFAAIAIGLCLLCCFLFGGDRERVRTRYIYSDEEEPRRGYATPPKNGYGSYPLRDRGRAYDDWPWSSDGRPPVAYNRGAMFDFDSRGGRDLGPRPAL